MSDTQEVDDFLEHFGVLGMKWGVRKLENHAATKTAKKEETDKRDRDILDARSKRTAVLNNFSQAEHDLYTSRTIKGKETALKLMEKYEAESIKLWDDGSLALAQSVTSQEGKKATRSALKQFGGFLAIVFVLGAASTALNL